MEIKKVLVVGSGLMGSGISQVCAQSGIEVILNDVSDQALSKARNSIEWSVGKLVEKGKLGENQQAIVGRIQFCAKLDQLDNVDLAIEAVFEDLEVKQPLLKMLDERCPPTTLIASNTSAIPITELAGVTKRPEQVLGLHFFSPVPMMKAVEVIRGLSTSDKTAAAGRAFVEKIGKEAIMVNRDVAGFVINRINWPSAIQAMKLVEAGVATCEDIDKGLRLASGRKMGIFETGDLVGLDVTYGGLMAVYQETGDPAFFPPLLLRRKVKAGHLGRKTGKGWYTYDENGNRIE
jgi:3-hydroxybutyryl-CoA dehydrogenase